MGSNPSRRTSTSTRASTEITRGVSRAARSDAEQLDHYFPSFGLVEFHHEDSLPITQDELPIDDGDGLAGAKRLTVTTGSRDV